MEIHVHTVTYWNILSFDVENAYLEAKVDKEIYKPVKIKFLKSLYGLRQAGERWNTHLNELFIKNNFKGSIHDICVYIQINNETNTKIYICVFVDGIFIIGNNQIEINNLIEKLKTQLTKLSILGEIQKYVGIDIKRDPIES
jgi:hypothetical protein